MQQIQDEKLEGGKKHGRFGYQLTLIQVSNVLLHPLQFLLATLSSVNAEFKYHSAMRVPFYRHPILVILAKFIV